MRGRGPAAGYGAPVPSLVVVLGPVTSLGALHATLEELGGVPVVEVVDAHPAVRPSTTWTHPDTGRTIGRGELDRFARHAAAWMHAAAAAGPVLVLEPGATIAPGAVQAALADEGDWSLVALDATRAYLLAPDAALELADEQLLADAVPLGVLFGLPDVPGDDEPFTDHLVVVEVDGLHDLAETLGGLDPYALVVAVPPRHRVLAGPAELCAVYAQTADGMVLTAATRHTPAGLSPDALDAHPDPGNEYRWVSALGVAGPVGAVADLLAGALDPLGGVMPDDAALTAAYLDGMCAIDSSCAVFQVADPAYGDAVVVHGRVVNGATDTTPGVLVAADARSLDPLAAELDTDGSRDLARVFRYDDAVDLSDDWRVAAADIVTVPFWTPAFCATIIRLAEAAEAWDRDPDDPVPGAEVSLAALSPRLFAHVQAHVDARVMPVLAQVWPQMAQTSLHDAFVIKYAVGANDELRLHHDIAQISGSLRLCTGYEGGRLEFPRQAWHNGELPVGRLAVWPSLVTHPHRSTPVEAGVKYGVTLWWKLPA